ncbi:MAG: RpiB/LacA/LacB family sugar-phosphate isomerase [bacterium]|nr:RpiB/LacA/LacB family sugar-phosphate isomerase [bacterium]
MKVYIAADHNGFRLKEKLEDHLKKSGYSVEDDGPERSNPEDDFPEFAAAVVSKILSSEDPEPKGILLCGSGQGMVMAANRFKGIRAALVYDRESARSSRNDDDANVMAMSAKLFESNPHEASVILEIFMHTPFAGAERFKRRIRELDNL